MPLLGLPPHVLESILDKLSLVDMIAFKLCSRKSKEIVDEYWQRRRSFSVSVAEFHRLFPYIDPEQTQFESIFHIRDELGRFLRMLPNNRLTEANFSGLRRFHRELMEDIMITCHVTYFYGMSCRRVEYVFGLHNDLRRSADEEDNASSFQDKAGTRSPGTEEWEAWLACARNPNQRPYSRLRNRVDACSLFSGVTSMSFSGCLVSCADLESLSYCMQNLKSLTLSDRLIDHPINGEDVDPNKIQNFRTYQKNGLIGHRARTIAHMKTLWPTLVQLTFV